MQENKYMSQFISLIKCKNELFDCAKYLKRCIRNTYEGCLISSISKPDERTKFEINTILDYLQDELNTGHWSEVPITTRRAFTAASFVKVLCYANLLETETKENLEDLLKHIDLGLLLGAPLKENENLLTNVAAMLSQKLHCYNECIISENSLKRKRFEIPNEYENLQATEITCIQCPSVENFKKYYFDLQLPVKLQDCMSHWPACRKWVDINYFLKIAGHRTVPVEIGSHYADENWSQKLITLQEFIQQHFLGSPKEIVYLAQHNLFDQITELKNDIFIPDYCCLSKDYNSDEDVDINAWFGPEGTISPLHYDPKDNILAQVFGTKQIILYAPDDSKYLYPHEGKLLSNTAQVNPVAADMNLHPEFRNARGHKCLLEPGEMLFIPAKWWHHVTALDKSFSVSFWWK